jgi:hypothetical protein
MTIDIIVMRGTGSRQGPDIVDPLITTIPVAVARGAYEINAATSVDVVALRSSYRPGVSPGQLVEVHDALQGRSWRGKVVDVSHNIQRTQIWTQLTVERLPQ